MKKFLKHIFVLVAVAYFLVFSLGFNLVHYCCAGCEEQGIGFIAQMACDKTSEAVYEQEESSCCSESKEAEDCTLQLAEDECCSFSRLHTDTPVFHGNAELSHLFESFDFDAYVNDFLYDADLSAVPEDYAYHNKIPPDTGRDILTRYAVLLI